MKVQVERIMQDAKDRNTTTNYTRFKRIYARVKLCEYTYILTSMSYWFDIGNEFDTQGFTI